MVWWFLPFIGQVIGAAVVGGAVGTAVGALIAVILDPIDEDNLGCEVKKQLPDAFKAKLTSKDTKRVYVDVYNQDSKVIAEDFVIESEKGVSASLEVGTEIYL